MSDTQHLVMPKLGLTMEEGLVSQWLVRPGDRFVAGQVLVAVENDKTVFDVEAPARGILGEILIQESETVPVGTPIAEWQLDGSVGSVEEEIAPSRARQDTAQPSLAPAALPLRTDETSDDVMQPTSAQKAMAERVTKAKRDIPHFYLALDIDASPIILALAEFNARHAGTVKGTLTHVLMAALARALVRVPAMNAVWTDSGIHCFQRVSIGLAVHTERGLVSPVVSDVDGLPFEALIARVDAVVDRARSSSLRTDDYVGAAMTLSNAGNRIVRYMSSIIVPGQSAIMGVGASKDSFRPNAQGQPELFKELGLVLSADHRLHTGVGALEFLDAFAGEIEQAPSIVGAATA